jgi:acyl-CoA synthetase (AMP-forming)/AMP-acid ligase II
MDPSPAKPFYTPQALAVKGRQLALVEDGFVMDYGQLAQSVEQLKSAWQQLPPARILLVSDYQSAMIVAMLALAQTPHVAIPTAPNSSDKDLSAAAQQAHATHRWQACAEMPLPEALIPLETAGTPHPLLQSLHAQQRAGLILFTSGSTGRSKTLLHDCQRLLSSLQAVTTTKPRKVLVLMHPDHIGGIDIVCKGLTQGSTLYFPPQRDPATVGEWIAKHAIDVLPATPTFLRLALLQGMFEQSDCRSLRIITYGAERMPPMLLQALRETLPEVDFRATFGTTETGTVRLRGGRQPDDWLHPDPDAPAMRVVNGDLWIKTPATLLGYLDENTARIDNDGWLSTGDLAEVRGDGAIRITGRHTALISIGGEKVDPLEIENALLRIEGIIGARVTAEPHALMGNSLTASIIPGPGFTTQPQAAWKQRLRRELGSQFPRWKIPSRIIVESSPESPGSRLKGKRLM